MPGRPASSPLRLRQKSVNRCQEFAWVFFRQEMAALNILHGHGVRPLLPDALYIVAKPRHGAIACHDDKRRCRNSVLFQVCLIMLQVEVFAWHAMR